MALIFGKKIDRGMEIMRERNRRYLEEYEDQHPSEEEETSAGTEEKDLAAERGENYVFRTDSFPGEGEDGEEEKVEFEKGDLFAIIVSALMVFWPVFLVLFIILFLTVRWMMHS